jgi:Na+/melibiose symporter-like transporter
MQNTRHPLVAWALTIAFVLSALLWAISLSDPTMAVVAVIAATGTTTSLSGLAACFYSHPVFRRKLALAANITADPQPVKAASEVLRGAVISAVINVIAAALLALVAGENATHQYNGMVAYCFIFGTAAFVLVRLSVFRS